MSAAVTPVHLATAGRIIGENSTYTPDCGRVLYRDAQGDIAQALADAEQHGRELERTAVARSLDDRRYIMLAADIKAGKHLEPTTKEEPTDGKA